MRLYIVTSGTYSDYTIEGVFDSEDLAQTFIDSRSWFDAVRIEHWPLNDIPDQAREGLKSYQVDILFDSADIINLKLGQHEKPGIAELKPRHVLHSRFPGHGYGKHYLRVFCWAKDEQHAAKIATEKRSQFLAQQDSEVNSE